MGMECYSISSIPGHLTMYSDRADPREGSIGLLTGSIRYPFSSHLVAKFFIFKTRGAVHKIHALG